MATGLSYPERPVLNLYIRFAVVFRRLLSLPDFSRNAFGLSARARSAPALASSTAWPIWSRI
jgi:hypothetical protein